MAVRIRLMRMGAINDRSFRIVATDGRSPRDGRYLESLGWYDPEQKGVNFQVKLDRIEHWKQRGAQVSTTVRSIIRRAVRAAK